MLVITELAKQIDQASGALAFLTVDHWLNHRGLHFLASDFGAAIGDGETRRYLIVTPDSTDEVHMLLEVAGSLHTEIEIYEDTLATGGTAIVNINTNREVKTAPNTVITHTPVPDSASHVAEGGTLIFKTQFGSDAAPQRLGGQDERAHEFVLEKNTSYLLEITSRTTANNVSVVFDYYELPVNKDTYSIKRV